MTNGGLPSLVACGSQDIYLTQNDPPISHEFFWKDSSDYPYKQIIKLKCDGKDKEQFPDYFHEQVIHNSNEILDKSIIKSKDKGKERF